MIHHSFISLSWPWRHSHILIRAKEGGFIAGFLVRVRGGMGLEVSHLLFADATLILCDDRKEHKEHLNWEFM